MDNNERDTILEKWSGKYKRSIDCNNPKGFSQKAHCAGRKKRKSGGKTKSKPVESVNSNESIKNRRTSVDKNQIKQELRQELKNAIIENTILSSDCVQEKLGQMDNLVKLHQEVLEKLEVSKHKPVLNKVLDEITNQLDEVEESLLEHIQTTKNNLNENEYGEGWMIKSQLYNIAKNAMKLHGMVNEKEDFEDWVQAKLTIVDDYMSTISQFIEYRKMTVGNFDMDDKQQYMEDPDEDLSQYDEQIPLL